MAQRAPIRLDSVRFDSPQSDLDWSDLRGASSRREYQRGAGRPLPSIIWVALVIIAGVAAVSIYMKYSSPDGATAPDATTSEDVSPTSVVPGHSLTKKPSRLGSPPVTGSSDIPQLQSTSPAAVERALPTIPPAAYLDVVTSSGHVPVRIASIAYSVNITSGAVQLIHSDFGSPTTAKAEFPMPVQALQALEKNVEATVVLHVITDRLGRVREWHILSGAPALTGAAVDAVRHWQFARSEVPAGRELTVTVSFKTSP
jgi:outer membrane biosynthesis protein TonB